MHEQPNSKTLTEKRASGVRRFFPVLFVVVPILIVAYVTSRDSRGLRSFSLIGSPAPEFSAVSVSGEGAPLASGAWRVVHFWTTTCTECRGEVPEIRRFVESKHPGDLSLELANVNIQDGREDVVRFVREFQLPPHVFLDVSGKMARAWGVTGVPETFFVDPTGVVRQHIVGATSSDTLERLLDEMLKTPTTAGK